MVLVKKKDHTWRMCVDNDLTVNDRFPIPLVEELLNELHGVSVFSKIWFEIGVSPSPMATADIHKTTFRTHEGHYEFIVMPFSLTNAPTTFQGLMNRVFKEQLRKYVMVFFDDILLYSKDWDQHVSHLESVLSLLWKTPCLLNDQSAVLVDLKWSTWVIPSQRRVFLQTRLRLQLSQTGLCLNLLNNFVDFSP